MISEFSKALMLLLGTRRLYGIRSFKNPVYSFDRQVSDMATLTTRGAAFRARRIGYYIYPSKIWFRPLSLELLPFTHMSLLQFSCP